MKQRYWVKLRYIIVCLKVGLCSQRSCFSDYAWRQQSEKHRGEKEVKVLRHLFTHLAKVYMLIRLSVLRSCKNLSNAPPSPTWGKEWGEGTLFDHLICTSVEAYWHLKVLALLPHSMKGVGLNQLGPFVHVPYLQAFPLVSSHGPKTCRSS